ncbi:MAG: SDR family oxidoreductase, partial [Gammaproteobacteria bacterium]|nr:SDR family oxidoreductase [Gammaproteobacteria bacterium]
MNILITGNMGYVGSVVARRLREKLGAATLVGADSGFFAHCLAGDGEVLPERVVDTQHFVDVRRMEPRHLDGIDAVVHLAGISNDPIGNAYESVTDEINHRVSVRLARMAREAGVRRFVFASSCSVYGCAEGAARSEEAELNPLTAYARSKIDAEIGLAPLADERLLVTCLRFPTACGMSPRLRLDLVLNDFVASAVATGVVRVISDGTPWRP